MKNCNPRNYFQQTQVNTSFCWKKKQQKCNTDRQSTQCLSNKCIEPQYNRIGLYFENKNKQKNEQIYRKFFCRLTGKSTTFSQNVLCFTHLNLSNQFLWIAESKSQSQMSSSKRTNKKLSQFEFFFSNDSNHFHLSFLLQLFHSKFKQFFLNVFMRKYSVIETHQTIQLDDRNFELRLISCALADYLLWF